MLGHVLLAGALCSLLGACLYRDACGDELVEDERGACVCPSGRVLADDGSGCESCPDGEVAAASGCECPEGQSRDANGSCVELALGLGRSCEEEACPQEYSHCAEEGSYCTLAGCGAGSSCPAPFACNISGATSYCQRPPVGQEMPCQSHSDCEGTEATYCESFSSNTCLVRDCLPGSCFAGWTCCDLTEVGLDESLCVPEGECVTS